jgi:hypothetical protein
MNANPQNLLKLKNKNGEDVYSIDTVNDTLVISPLKQSIDIFDTLIMSGADTGDVHEINISELFVSALLDAVGETNCTYKLVKNNIVFREISECFSGSDPDNLDYVPPDGKQVLGVLGNKHLTNQPYVHDGKAPGVNDPCLCGKTNPDTGRVYKFKKCCGRNMR